jgi:hypothetical protein
MGTYQDPYPPFSINSDFNSPDFNSHYLEPTDSISAFVLSTFFPSHQLVPQSLPWDGTYQPPPHPNAHHFPVEIFSEVFLYTVQDDPRSQTNLMLVCRYWRDIMLSTPGIHSQLRIYGRTRRKHIERFGRRWLLDVTIDMTIVDYRYVDGRYKPMIDPVDFFACFMAAAEAASRWRSLVLNSLPPPGEYKDLQIIHPLQRLESFKLDASCELGNSLEPLLTAITKTVTPLFTVMEIFHPDAALYLVQPAHFQIFSSLTTLRLICRRMQNPVDILPFLHKLEIFEAHHLSLPICSPVIDLPLTQILRVLHLRSVSIQWIAGRVFPVLKDCSIIFPHHADTIRSVYMPSCSILKYDSNNLRTLGHFHYPPLARLEVKCGQWTTSRGNLQLAALHPIFAAQSLTCLHLKIKCSEWLLAFMLGLAPVLKELWMGLSAPQALSSAFFLAFAAGGRDASAGSSRRTTAPLCKHLRKLHLHYKRWSRGAERNALIQAFGAIMASHPPEEQNFTLRLSFGEGPELQEWTIHEPVQRFDVKWERGRTVIGVSSPYGIVPLSRASRTLRASTELFNRHFTELEYPPLPGELEYITTHELLELPIDYFLSFHSLKEVRMICLSLKIGPNTQFSPNAPLFHTLKVLAVDRAPSSFYAGQTFHNLERFQTFGNWGDNPGQGQLIEMPRCTRLSTSLSILPTLKLPQIRELVVLMDHKEPDRLWAMHVTVNANLSGLKLLSFSDCGYGLVSSFTDITKILGLLPSLETLVLQGENVVDPFVTFFEALISMNVQETSGPKQSGRGGQIFCPRLESLQIENFNLFRRPEVMPVLKDIITLRANAGSPLKSFTFYHYLLQKKWELIGRDGSFIMEVAVPALRFQLDI